VDEVESAKQGYYFDNENSFIYVHLNGGNSPESFEMRTGSAQREIQQSYLDLTSMGLNVNSFVAPYGDFNESLLEFIAPYYNSIVGSKPFDQNYNLLPLTDLDSPIKLTRTRSITQDTSVEDVIKIIDEAEEEDAWVILTFHAIYDKESDPYGWSPDKFEQLAAYIHQKGVDVVTISEGIASRTPVPLPSSFSLAIGGLLLITGRRLFSVK